MASMCAVESACAEPLIITNLSSATSVTSPPSPNTTLIAIAVPNSSGASNRDKIMFPANREPKTTSGARPPTMTRSVQP